MTWSLLSEGILVGRYARCNLSSRGLGRMSRVHALLVVRDGELWALDLASTNGITVGGREVQAGRLVGGTQLECGGLFLRYQPRSAAAA
ncbi:MAG: FHA domain-containing protein [Deltaproteobacteria bacterium]|nr:FHA domain-containing protein [Deltaproteobacteria bacterium]